MPRDIACAQKGGCDLTEVELLNLWERTYVRVQP
jgi:hypothetical protein